MGRLKTGIAKVRRLINVHPTEDQEISEYSGMLSLSKSEVHELMRRFGRSKFRELYIEPLLKKKEEEKKSKAEIEEDEYLERRRKWREYLRAVEGRDEVNDDEDLARRLDESLKRRGFKKKGEL